MFSDGSPVLPSISQAWTQLLSQANSSVSIAAFYFTLRASDQGLTDPSDLQVRGQKGEPACYSLISVQLPFVVVFGCLT